MKLKEFREATKYLPENTEIFVSRVDGDAMYCLFEVKEPVDYVTTVSTCLTTLPPQEKHEVILNVR